MTLKREDYPDLSDEQWDELKAEFDRARTQASETARKNAEKAAEKARETEIQDAISAAVEDERARIEASETERLELDRQKVEDERAKLATERRTFTAHNRLVEAGISSEKADEMVTLFAGVDDKALDTTLDTFINTYQETVKAQVDTEKQNLLDNATPPAGSTTAPKDMSTVAAEKLESGDTVGALSDMLESAGYGEANQ